MNTEQIYVEKNKEIGRLTVCDSFYQVFPSLDKFTEVLRSLSSHIEAKLRYFNRLLAVIILSKSQFIKSPNSFHFLLTNNLRINLRILNTAMSE